MSHDKFVNTANDIMAVITVGGSLAALKDIVSIVIPILTFMVLVIINHRKITEESKTFIEKYFNCKKQ